MATRYRSRAGRAANLLEVCLEMILSSLHLTTLQNLFKEGVPDIEWRIDKLIPKSGIVIFGGTSGTYKTFTAMQLAQAVSTGKTFLDHFATSKGRVLYLDEENGKITVFHRFKQLMYGHAFHDDTFSDLFLGIHNGVKLDDIRENKLKILLKQCNPNVVIIDSMVRCMIGEEDRANHVRKVFDMLKPFLNDRDDVVFIILHHTVKRSKGKMGIEGLRGSGDFAAFADVILMFDYSNGFVNIEMVKNRHIDRETLSKFSIHVEKVLENNIKLKYIECTPDEINAVEACCDELKEWFQQESIVKFRTGQALKYAKSRAHSKNAVSDALKELKKDKTIAKLSHGLWEVL